MTSSMVKGCGWERSKQAILSHPKAGSGRRAADGRLSMLLVWEWMSVHRMHRLDNIHVRSVKMRVIPVRQCHSIIKPCGPEMSEIYVRLRCTWAFLP
jgi:hypothetical protein